MQRPHIIITLTLITLGTAILQCSAQLEGQPNTVFRAPSTDAINMHAGANLMQAISANHLSDDAQHIMVTNVNGSTVLKGFVKDDRERQMISHLAQQANCPDVINQLKVRSLTSAAQKSKQSHKAKTIVIKNGKQIVIK